MKILTLKEQIKNKGLKIGFLEKQAELPTCTLYNHINQKRPIPAHHLPALKKVLKKYKINFVV